MKKFFNANIGSRDLSSKRLFTPFRKRQRGLLNHQQAGNVAFLAERYREPNVTSPDIYMTNSANVRYSSGVQVIGIPNVQGQPNHSLDGKQVPP